MSARDQAITASATRNVDSKQLAQSWADVLGKEIQP